MENSRWGRTKADGRAERGSQARQTYHVMSSSISDRCCETAIERTFSSLSPVSCLGCWRRQVGAVLECHQNRTSEISLRSDEEPGTGVPLCPSPGLADRRRCKAAEMRLCRSSKEHERREWGVAGWRTRLIS
jgi:hypothetical protein